MDATKSTITNGTLRSAADCTELVAVATPQKRAVDHDRIARPGDRAGEAGDP